MSLARLQALAGSLVQSGQASAERACGSASPRPLGEGNRAQRGGVGSARENQESPAPPPPSASRPPPPEVEERRARALYQRKGRAALAALLVLSGLVLVAQAAWIPAKAALAQLLLERAFAQSLAEGRPVRPWPWADTVPVARLGLAGSTFIALAGSSGQALAFGPGHVEGTPEPGEPGTTVYSAHRDTQFAVLGRLTPGDVVSVTRSDGRIIHFRVTGRRITRFDRSGIDPTAAGNHLALTTCWPLDAVTQGPDRLIVEAEMVSP